MDDSARMWVERLQNGNCSEQDYAEFDRWIATDKARQLAFERARCLYLNVDLLTSRETSTPIPRQSVTRTAPADPDSRSARPITAFAPPIAIISLACFLLSALGVFWWLPLVKNTYTTEIGKQRVVTLADGTKVTLDTDSQIRVAYREDERRVALQRGRAYFDVAPNPARAFIVVVDNGEVKAAGTAFSVHKAQQGIEVALLKGEVEVQPDTTSAPPRRTEILTSGEQLIYQSDGGVQRASIANLNERMSWFTGKLIFSSRRLADVVKEVNRYSEKTIRLASPKLHDLEIDAVFNIGDLETFVLTLQSSFDLMVMRQLNGDIELKNR